MVFAVWCRTSLPFSAQGQSCDQPHKYQPLLSTLSSIHRIHSHSHIPVIQNYTKLLAHHIRSSEPAIVVLERDRLTCHLAQFALQLSLCQLTFPFLKHLPKNCPSDLVDIQLIFTTSTTPTSTPHHNANNNFPSRPRKGPLPLLAAAALVPFEGLLDCKSDANVSHSALLDSLVLRLNPISDKQGSYVRRRSNNPSSLEALALPLHKVSRS